MLGRVRNFMVMRRWLRRVAAMVMAVVAVTSLGSTVGRAHDSGLSTYSIVDLGNLPDNTDGTCGARGINDRGEVIGGVTRDEGIGAASGFLWHDGVMTDLSRSPGFANSAAAGINREGRVVGYSYNLPMSNGFQGWIWQKDRFVDLSANLWPVSINASEQVAGFTREGRIAAVWDRGALTLLPPNGYQSDATAINERGVIVGEVYVSTPGSTPVTHAVLWRNGGVIDLGRLGPLSTSPGAYATAINDRDWVVGASPVAGMPDHAFVWIGDHMFDLGTAPGFTGSRANGINDNGDVVGVSTVYDPVVGRVVKRATLWHRGQAIDLNGPKPAGFPGTLQEASAINERGQIVGWFTTEANPRNSFHSKCFLMTPVDT
jgi:probable HAF family extracellular repeat protein